MTPWFYIFIISLAGIVSVISLRVFEDTRGTLRVVEPVRKVANKLVRSVIFFVRDMSAAIFRYLGDLLVRAWKRLIYNKKLRGILKRTFLIITRLTHDIVVVFLHSLSRLREWIQGLHDRYLD